MPAAECKQGLTLLMFSLLLLLLLLLHLAMCCRQPSTRQLLLMCSCPAERLRLLLELLQRLDRLCCSCCGTQLATTAEVLAMNTEGIGGTYVNSHG
jgi:hypothetical protein